MWAKIFLRYLNLACSFAVFRKLWVLPDHDEVHQNLVFIFMPIGDTSLGKYNKQPRLRVQKAENVNKALEFINSRGVKLTNIGPEGKLLPIMSSRLYDSHSQI